MTILAGARVVTPDGVLPDGWVRVADARIAAVGRGEVPPGEPDVQRVTGWLVPGFVDLHVHGGGGHDFTASRDDMRAGIAFHRSRGTTRSLVSLMAAPVDRLVNQVRWAAELAGRDGVVGVHLEGPFLARARCGAQNQAHLVPPDPLVLARLLDAGQGTIRTITIAPELPGALPLIEKIAAAGVVAAVGHTDATYEQAAAGIAAGATLATHLFNAMGPIKQRAPGPALAALDSELFVELINDGIHVHDALGRLVGAVAPSRLCLVTDAISATGVGDGHYTLGDQPVLVDGGAARLAGTDRLAGSTLTMDEAFRRAVRDLGLSMEAAVAATSGNPARLLDLADSCGAIAPGLDADLVLLGDDLSVRGVMAAGAWLAPR